MKTTTLLSIALLFLLAGFQQKKDLPKWALKATYHESCSCNAPCPCPFGLPMTNSFCKLNSLVEIHEGHYNNINLAGVRVILSGSAGQWGEYYFDESTTIEQQQAVEVILKTVGITGFTTILNSKRTHISFEKKDDKLSFSTSNIKVEMTMVKGNNNQPVIVQNLKGKLFENYIPYLSHTNIRSFSDTSYNFSFKKKAGFTAQWDLTDNNYK